MTTPDDWERPGVVTPGRIRLTGRLRFFAWFRALPGYGRGAGTSCVVGVPAAMEEPQVQSEPSERIPAVWV